MNKNNCTIQVTPARSCMEMCNCSPPLFQCFLKWLPRCRTAAPWQMHWAPDLGWGTMQLCLTWQTASNLGNNLQTTVPTFKIASPPKWIGMNTLLHLEAGHLLSAIDRRMCCIKLRVLAISTYLKGYRRAVMVLAPGPALLGWCQGLLGKQWSSLFLQLLLCQPKQQGQVIRWELGAGH